MVLEPAFVGNDLVFEFNGFKGSYDLSVELGNGTLVSTTNSCYPMNEHETLVLLYMHQ